MPKIDGEMARRGGVAWVDSQRTIRPDDLDGRGVGIEEGNEAIGEDEEDGFDIDELDELEA